MTKYKQDLILKVNNSRRSRRSAISDIILITIGLALITIGVIAIIINIINGEETIYSKGGIALIGYPFFLIFVLHYVWLAITTRDYILGKDFLRLPSPRFTKEFKQKRFKEPVILFSDIKSMEVIQSEEEDWIDISDYKREGKVIGLKITTKDDKEYSIVDRRHYPLKKTLETILNYQYRNLDERQK